jgi:predicted nucleic acid-binding protein
MSNRLLNEFIIGFQAYAEPFTPDPSVSGVAPDDEDDLVLGTAVAAEADFLVTGDKGFLAVREFRGVRIVTADEFLAELEKE